MRPVAASPVPSTARPTAPAAAQRRTEGRTAQLRLQGRLDSLASIDASRDAPTGALAHHMRAAVHPPVGRTAGCERAGRVCVRREFDGLCPQFERRDPRWGEPAAAYG
ncbi:hypothetical protein GCM10010297_23810 [Streptomyces malachitofuscus]|nr:hypothetical protein GCM10010297_23810 [Streptomyces malachitofuscus]